MESVFVFGTLKEGFPNFAINSGTRFRNKFETKDRFPLYLVGERYSPWLVLDKGKGNTIKGEVYRVTKEALAEMDKLERISEPDGYFKVIIQVTCCDSGEIFDVFVYGKQVDQLKHADIRKELMGEYLLEHSELYRSRNS